MKRTLPLITTLLLMTATASAQDYGQTATLKIWDNTTAPHSNGITTPETEKEPNRVRNTSEATLYIFPADKAKATGQAVVICPGGGYGMLAMDHEGYEMAKWFAANGITGAVLKYRMPNHHPEVPLEDAVQALAHHGGTRSGRHGLHGGQSGHRRLFGRRTPRGDGLDDRQFQTGLLGPLLPGHHGRAGQTPPGIVHQSAERAAHPRAGRSLLAGEPRDGRHPARPSCCSRTTTRPFRPSTARSTTTP